MKILIAMTMILASAGTMGAMGADYSVGIAPGGLNLYSITQKGVKLVKGSPFVTPVFDAYPVTPVIVAMNTQHNFVYVLYEHLTSLEPLAYIVGFKITEEGLQQKWVFQPLDMNPEANPLVELTAGPNYAIAIWTNDFTSPYTGWIINESGQLVAGVLSLFNGNEHISDHVAPHENFYYFCHYVGYPGPQTETVSAYSLDKDTLNGKVQPPFLQPQLLFNSTDPVFVESVCN